MILLAMSVGSFLARLKEAETLGDSEATAALLSDFVVCDEIALRKTVAATGGGGWRGCEVEVLRTAQEIKSNR